jgi:hypothetical protein
MLRHLESNLDTYGPGTPAIYNKNFIASSSLEPELFIELQQLKVAIKRYTVHLREMHDSRHLQEPTINESMLRYFTPLLFILALVIRAAKTSIELRNSFASESRKEVGAR